MIAFIAGGFDTSSHQLTSITYILSTHPEIRVKLHSEIKNILDGKLDNISYAMLDKMDYLSMFLNECQWWDLPVLRSFNQSVYKEFEVDGMKF